MPGCARLFHRRQHDLLNHLNMRARGEFRNDTSEPFMDGVLGGYDIGPQ
jgi:hypothetical protein